MTTDNHGYNVPDEGETDWHVPLNENFEQYDTDIEIRDRDANRGDYEPKSGAKFLATDTEKEYVGDGSRWQHLGSTGTTPSFTQLNPSNDFLGVGRSSRIGAEYFGVQAPVGSGSYGGMYINTDANGGWPFYGYATGGDYRAWHYYDGSDGTWRLHNGSDALVVDDSGQVGIGTDSPDAALEVFDSDTKYSGSIVGETDQGVAAGVRGVNTTDKAGWGVEGRIDSSTGSSAGVLGVDTGISYGVWGKGKGKKADGVSGMTYNGGGAGVVGEDMDGGALGVLSDGDCRVEGDLEVTGNKNFVETVDVDGDEREVVYTAPEAGTPRTEASGVAGLEDGRAEIDLPDHFAWVTDPEEPLIVQVTPYGGERGLKVVERSRERIVVEDLDGTGDYEFSYTVKGTRDGHADEQVVREPSADATRDTRPTPADD